MRSTLALFGLAQPIVAQYASYTSIYGGDQGYGYQDQYGVRTCATGSSAVAGTNIIGTVPVCNFDETCVSGICLKSRGAPTTPHQPCNVDYDCPAQQSCTGGVCVPPGWRCTQNSDCGQNQACFGGSCQALYASNPPASDYWCNVDSQCTVYEKCDNYHCVRCQPGECLNRGSLSPCFQDSQCLLAEICTQGLCQSKPCKTDNQCGYTEVCDPTNQVCVDCTSGLTLPNSGNVYNPSYNYNSNSNYNSNYNYGSTSCTGTGSGYWCYSDNQCPMNEVCDGSNCRSTGPPVPFQCSSDAQCGLTQKCNAGLCVSGLNQGNLACQFDTDCAYNQVCQGTVCISGGYAAWVPHN